MSSAEYQKAYRAKNQEKMRAYEKERAKTRYQRKKLMPEISKESETVIRNDMEMKQRSCQAAHCTNPANECLIEGMKAFLCWEHRQ